MVTLSAINVADAQWRLVREELASAMEKFPPFNSGHEGYATILEELDELWDEVRKQYGPDRDAAMRREAIEVAAMAIRFLVDVVP